MLRSVSRAIICRASSTVEITGVEDVERFCRGGGGGGGDSNLVESIQTTAVAATVAAATRTVDGSRIGLYKIPIKFKFFKIQIFKRDK